MQPQPGDHIYGARKGGLYDHHGIYVGNDRVIHMTAPAKQSYSLECRNCGYKRDGNGGLVKTCLNCFLDGYSLCIYDYGVPISVYKTKHRRGTCSMYTSKPANEVVQTATDLLERGRNGFGEYNLISNNCEHFAVYCKTGRASSEQVVGVVEEVAQEVDVVLPAIARACVYAGGAILAVGGVVIGLFASAEARRSRHMR